MHESLRGGSSALPTVRLPQLERHGSDREDEQDAHIPFSPVYLTAKEVLCDFDRKWDGKPAVEIDAALSDGGNDTAERLEDIWQEKLRKNSRLYNGSKFRLAGVTQTEEGKLTLHLGMTDYKQFICTNCAPLSVQRRLVEASEQLSEKRDKDLFFSNAFGVSAVVLTNDNFVILIQRAAHVGEFPGYLDLPGGHPEPDIVLEIIKKAFGGKVDEIIGGKETNEIIVQQFFDSITSEVLDEIGDLEKEISSPVLLGFLRNKLTAGRPSAAFLINCNITGKQVRDIYLEGKQVSGVIR